MSVVASAANHDLQLFHRALERLPAGAYTCDAQGLITWFNVQAVELWGRAPRINDPVDRFCGSSRLFSAHGMPIVHAESWMALALRDRREHLGQEIVVERPNRSRVTVLAYATPLFDAQGELTGAVNMLVNISDRKRVEQVLAEANRANDFYRATLADAMRDEIQPMHTALVELAGEPNPVLRERCVAQLHQQLARMSALIDELVDGKGGARGMAPAE